MGKNRDRLSILAAILEAANSHANKTRIMSEANLSFTLLEKYLDMALKAELVCPKEYKYTLTEKGREFLKKYKHFEVRYIRAQTLLKTLNSEREKLSQSCDNAWMFSDKRSAISANSKLTLNS
jgi:predicted transcriptional regulator